MAELVKCPCAVEGKVTAAGGPYRRPIALDHLPDHIADRDCPFCCGTGWVPPFNSDAGPTPMAPGSGTTRTRGGGTLSWTGFPAPPNDASFLRSIGIKPEEP